MIVSCQLRHRFEYNRIDTDNLTLCGHNNLCGGEIEPHKISKETYLVCARQARLMPASTGDQRIWALLIFSHGHVLPSCVCLFVLSVLPYLDFGKCQI